MKPTFLLDISDYNPDFSHIQFKVNSPFANINHATEIAELVNLRTPGANILPLIVSLDQFNCKRGVHAVAIIQYTYRRLWAQPILAKLPNAVLTGAVMCVQGCFELPMLSYLFGINANSLAIVVNTVREAISKLRINYPEFHADYYVEVICVFLNLERVIVDKAKLFSARIVACSQLLPIGTTTQQALASVSVLYAALCSRIKSDVISYAAFADIPGEAFFDLCDWIWCSDIAYWKAQPGMSDPIRYTWYFNYWENIEKVMQMCKSCGVQGADLDRVTTVAEKLPRALYRKRQLFVSAAIILATGHELPTATLNRVLRLSRKTKSQLYNYRKVLDAYL